MADWTDGLTGEQRNAATAINSLFTQYGIGTLASKIVEYVKQGYSSDTISLLLQDSPEYKQRFVANDARQKAGLSVLSPSEYLATERQYKAVLTNAGMPVGFYDQPSDFAGFLTQDTSPAELQTRVNAAAQWLNTTDPAQRQAWKDVTGWSDGDMVAGLLDAKRAQPLVEKTIKAVGINTAARQSGLSTTGIRSLQLADMGVTEQQAQSGYAQVGQNLETLQGLGNISGEGFNQTEAEDAQFFGGAAAKKQKRLASQERARFSGGTSGGKGLGSNNQGY